MVSETLLATLFFAVIFVFRWRLHRSCTPRAMLSFDAAATVSYMFIRMLPELDEAGPAFVSDTLDRARAAPEVRVYHGRFWPFVSGTVAYTAILALAR